MSACCSEFPNCEHQNREASSVVETIVMCQKEKARFYILRKKDKTASIITDSKRDSDEPEYLIHIGIGICFNGEKVVYDSDDHVGATFLENGIALGTHEVTNDWDEVLRHFGA